MSILSNISGKEAAKIFQKFGYVLDHQTGSHMILRHVNEPHRRLSVPNHKELSKGLLRDLIKEAGLTVEEFKDFGPVNLFRDQFLKGWGFLLTTIKDRREKVK